MFSKLVTIQDKEMGDIRFNPDAIESIEEIEDGTMIRTVTGRTLACNKPVEEVEGLIEEAVSK